MLADCLSVCVFCSTHFILSAIKSNNSFCFAFCLFFSHSPFVLFELISFVKDRFSFPLIVMVLVLMLVYCSYYDLPGFFSYNALTTYIYWFVVFFRPVYISVSQFDFNCNQQRLMKSVKLTIEICYDGNDDENKPKQR